MQEHELALIDGRITQRRIKTVTGLDMNVLMAGADAASDRPLVLLLHGFPELAFSWRKIMPALADAGFWVVAPDQRGYGDTRGHSEGWHVDLREFGMPALTRDVLALVAALGRRHVDLLVGHDFGSFVAGSCALMRPDVFRSVVLMSAPYRSPQAMPLGPLIEESDTSAAAMPDVHAELAKLSPPRRHYQWYYSEQRAAGEMDLPPEGLSAFLRAYYHMKSGDWPGNRPFPLREWTAEALAKLPTYYVMELGSSMPEAVRPHAPSERMLAHCNWLTDAELGVYAAAFAKTGFQSSLNWYRARTTGADAADLSLFAGRTIDVPTWFVAGSSDWGIEQTPGARVALSDQVCTDFRGEIILARAGHWVQQEAPEAVRAELVWIAKHVTGRV